MTPNPLMTSVVNADRLELTAAGSWTAANADRLERLVDAVALEAARARSIVIDTASVEQLDILGAWLLERLARMMLIQSPVGSIPNSASHRWEACAVCSNSGIAQPQQHIFGSHPSCFIGGTRGRGQH